MLIISDKVDVYVNGEYDRTFNTMMDALEYVHNNCIGKKIKFQTKREVVEC